MEITRVIIGDVTNKYNPLNIMDLKVRKILNPLKKQALQRLTTKNLCKHSRILSQEKKYKIKYIICLPQTNMKLSFSSQKNCSV